MGKIILALLLPGLLVVLFTRITYNRYVALILAIALLAVSVYAGYTTTLWLFIVDALSLTAGFAVATHLMKARQE